MRLLSGVMNWAQTIYKERSEWGFWSRRQAAEGQLTNSHYEPFYTTHFDLDHDFYRGKRMLDIGCGPRGSLEWANMTAERVGLDPLADRYMKLGADKHQMSYVACGSEVIPFDDGYFDVVCSFNSLDHVDDLDKTIEQICRVVKPGGLFLLLTDLNHEPTAAEPITFSWDIVDKFSSAFDLLDERRYEKITGLYQSLDAGTKYDESDTRFRYGVLSAKFRRKS